MPTPSDVHVNVPLTNLSVGYIQANMNFIASAVFPIVPVQKQADLYYKYPRDAFNRDEMKLRAPATESAGTDYNVETDSYYARVWALHHDIPDEVRANSDAQINPDRDATYMLTQKALINREVAWTARYFTGSVWSRDYDGSAAPTTGQYLHWSDPASDPIGIIRATATNIQEATGFRPNVLVLGQRVIDGMVDHPDFIDRIKYGASPGQPAIVNRQALAALFEVDRIVVASAVRNTAKEGATESNAFIAGKNALLVYAAPNPGVMTPSAGYTFSWVGRVGAGAAGQGFVVSKFRRQNEVKADRVEVEAAYDQKLVAADLGAFFEGIVA